MTSHQPEAKDVVHDRSLVPAGLMELQLFGRRAIVKLTDVLNQNDLQPSSLPQKDQRLGRPPTTKRYDCTLCKTSYSSKHQLSKHIIEHHGSLCEICGQFYDSRHAYRMAKHWKEHLYERANHYDGKPAHSTTTSWLQNSKKDDNKLVEQLNPSNLNHKTIHTNEQPVIDSDDPPSDCQVSTAIWYPGKSRGNAISVIKCLSPTTNNSVPGEDDAQVIRSDRSPQDKSVQSDSGTTLSPNKGRQLASTLSTTEADICTQVQASDTDLSTESGTDDTTTHSPDSTGRMNMRHALPILSKTDGENTQGAVSYAANNSIVSGISLPDKCRYLKQLLDEPTSDVTNRSTNHHPANSLPANHLPANPPPANHPPTNPPPANHLSSNHPPAIPPPANPLPADSRLIKSSDTLMCRICGCRILSNKLAIRTHYLANHREKINERILLRKKQQRSSSKPAQSTDLNSKLVLYLSCQSCGFQTTDSNILASHIASMHAITMKFCDRCDYQTLFKEDLDKHKKDFHALLQCKYCHVVAHTRAELADHMDSIHYFRIPY